MEIVWTDVPGAGQLNRNGFAVILRADGVVDLVYGRMQTREAIAGVTPGGTVDFTAADLSRGAPAGTRGALVERFSEAEEVDLVASARRFYVAHPDAFDQIVLYTTRPLNPVAGTLAFEINVKNAVRGIGVDVLDASATWGSAGALESVVFMDTIDAYLEVDGLEVLAHEVGHRWLARLRYATTSGASSGALMSGDAVHWSFFHDTPSFLGGNLIAEAGARRFETVDFARARPFVIPDGPAPAAEVPAVFPWKRPTTPRTAGQGASPSTPASAPGVRRDVRFEQIIAHGSRCRRPPRRRDMADRLVLISDANAPASPRRGRGHGDSLRLTRFFGEATGGRIQRTLGRP